MVAQELEASTHPEVAVIDQRTALAEIEEWACEALEERMDVLRTAALIRRIHDLAGFRF